MANWNPQGQYTGIGGTDARQLANQAASPPSDGIIERLAELLKCSVAIQQATAQVTNLLAGSVPDDGSTSPSSPIASVMNYIDAIDEQLRRTGIDIQRAQLTLGGK